MQVDAHAHSATYEHEHAMGDEGMMSPIHAHEHDEHPHGQLHGHSYTLYGSVRSGIYMVNPGGDGDTTWDIGSVDAGDIGSGDKLWSRLGVRGSIDLDNGMTAGFQVEKRLDNFRTRHQNVSLSGGFGTVTVGQQTDAYYSATSWDGANFFGGSTDVGSRTQSLRYSSNLGGPFNFSVSVTDDNSAMTADKIHHAHGEDGKGDATDEMKTTGNGDGADAWTLTGSLATGPLSINAGYVDVNEDTNRVGVTVGGSFAGLGWEVGYEEKDVDKGNGSSRYGGFVSYGVGAGSLFALYEDMQTDDGKGEIDAVVLGYAHPLGSGVSVIGEHRSAGGTDAEGADKDTVGTSAVVLVVSF